VIDALELGQKIVAIAKSHDGACACPMHKQTIFDAVGMPFDTRPFRVVDGKCIGMSTCYVFALNCLRSAGVAIHNWHVGEPIGVMIAWARANQCWQPPGDGLQPGSGDVIVVGKDGGTHVAVVVDCDGIMLTTIDGGQNCRKVGDGHDGEGRQLIARRNRVWEGESVRGFQTDPVVGWIDVARSPLTQ
jgi:hypothetical protein